MKNFRTIGALCLVVLTVAIIAGVFAAQKMPDKCKLCHMGCANLDGEKKTICDSACDATVCKQ